MSLLIQRAVDHFIGAKTYWFRLPIPPSANVIWRNKRHQTNSYLNPKYAKWLDDASLLVPFIKHPPGRRWEISARFYLYYMHKIANMDVDNRLKPLVDFFKARIQIDDRYLSRANIERINVKSPRTRHDHYCEVFLTIY